MNFFAGLFRQLSYEHIIKFIKNFTNSTFKLANGKSGWKKSAIFYSVAGIASVKMGHCLYTNLTKKNFKNKYVLVTGGGSGIGRELVKRFYKEGSYVMILDIDQNGILETRKLLKEEFPDEINEIEKRVDGRVCDITNKEEVYKVAKKIKSARGNVDILINNAGIVGKGSILKCTDEQIETVMAVNCISHFWLVRAFLPGMIENNSGHITVVSSIAGISGIPGMSDYSCSKFGSFGMHEALRLKMKKEKRNINVTIVCPNLVNTQLFRNATSIIPFLDKKQVADKIVEGMKRRQSLIVIPWWLEYVVYTLRAFTNDTVTDNVCKFLGGYSALDGMVDQAE